jgi:hypothetical protein
MLAAMIAVLPTTAAVAQAQGASQRNAPLAVPIAGTAAPGVGLPANSTVAGTFNIQRFANRNGALVAIGNFVGTVTNTATGVAQTVVAPLAIPVNTQLTTGTCEILHLVLGPLDLNLLGLQVHLNQVVLDITAVPGAGNLLGNLLCAIAGLLDGPNPLGGLAALLNNLLAALGSL